jgi:uncharacterized protein (DUF433 family)
MTELDWSKCPDVESVEGRCGGAWVVKDSRVMVQGIIDNAEDASPEEVADMFELPVEQVRKVLLFAYQSELNSLTEAHMRRPDLPRAYYYRVGLLVKNVAEIARALRPRPIPTRPQPAADFGAPGATRMTDAPETIWIVREDDLAFEWHPTKETAKTWGTPVEYIRADLFNAKADEMMENARVYDAERELFISRLVSLLERAREATDDHALFSDIGEALPNLRPPR